MADSKSQTILRASGFNYSSSSSKSVSYISKESRKFTSSMLYNSTDSDTVDNASFNQKTNGFQSRNYETFMKSTNNCSVNGKSTSMCETSTTENYSNGTSSKSFIQQRVERLYGPGALAQGFFINKRTKTRPSESENVENPSTTNGTVIPTSDLASTESQENDLNLNQSCSSPSLPVLRHLRPEFRAQLPILSPKRVFNDNTTTQMQKSQTVPLVVAATNGHEPKLLLNGSKTVDSLSENKENIAESLLIDDKLPSKQSLKIEDLQQQDQTVKLITEEIPAAPQVILPLTKAEIIINGKELENDAQPEVRDGHYFLKILKTETDRLILLAVKAEVWLEEEKSVLSDDALGHLRSASGKARLLVTQKMQQFEGLCHKNLNQIPGEPFPTTAEDLQGFWDMVMLQVTQVDDLFEELDALKANNWVIQEIPNPGTDAPKPKKVIVVKKVVSAEAEAQRKQREAARKKMIEEKRRAMRSKQLQPEQAIEIFVPESS